jgi:hypothetical protein
MIFCRYKGVRSVSHVSCNVILSVSKARFVTAGAISMKLVVIIPLGNTPSAFCPPEPRRGT